MAPWQWLIWILATGIGVVFITGLIVNLDALFGWGLIVDIPEGHPDQFDSMDTRDRGIR